LVIVNNFQIWNSDNDHIFSFQWDSDNTMKPKFKKKRWLNFNCYISRTKTNELTEKSSSVSNDSEIKYFFGHSVNHCHCIFGPHISFDNHTYCCKVIEKFVLQFIDLHTITRMMLHHNFNYISTHHWQFCTFVEPNHCNFII
jgi:hypothetical protein